ncbi:GNAT family N-acetyltransferase [Flavobacterium tegetincola]|uniref:GNAT family N-acetyltransferase n=1 Tax=Flavobacterium tegetincola TaxID=150172 RepID=UPI0004082233|nr:GNAT family N-acetyltransferase [Flavobacterium tegetincola]
MIELKKILKKDILDLLADEMFWKHSFLSISKHRLYAHFKNPNLKDDDIVLLLSYLNAELVGYMGVFTDTITIDSIQNKIGWLSTWWVHPKTKGSGIGREILNGMYAELNGKIGISQFTPSAKRVYDKSGYFTTLKENVGIKAVLRSNLTFVIPTIYPNLKKFESIFKISDHFINFFVNLKLVIQKKSIANKLQGISVDYLQIPDQETLKLINRFNKNDLSHKGFAFFEWLKTYNWVQSAPLLNFTQKDKYEFSMYDKSFEISFLKILKEDSCIGFVVLQKRNYVLKVLFTYYDPSNSVIDIANIIKLQAIAQNTREIICYDEAICANLKASSVFLYKTKKIKHSIISKAFNTTDFNDVRMHFGDGDCSFA